MKKILIAEDDEAIAEMLQLVLEGEGYDVETQADGHVVRMMNGPSPDLLFLDIHLSGIDGRVICRHLKSQERTRHIPIVLISAVKERGEGAKEVGADAFLAKPFEMQDFLTLIADLLKNK